MKLKCLTSCSYEGKHYIKGDEYDLSADEVKALDYNFEKPEDKPEEKPEEKSEDKPEDKPEEKKSGVFGKLFKDKK